MADGDGKCWRGRLDGRGADTAMAHADDVIQAMFNKVGWRMAVVWK